MKKEPIEVREVEASVRSSNFNEVVAGYAEDQALREASRCIQCKKPFCQEGCPVGIDIKQFIGHITKKDYQAAYLTIREKNNFPSICGRVCPAEYQCRKACVMSKKGLPYASREAINIHFLERFVGDYGMKNGLKTSADADARLSKYKVAIVGSGPAGLCCAGELARRGIKVTVFEGLHKTGGVLRYGIPPFRMPRDILDFEIDSLKTMGVEIATNFIVGKGRFAR
jgi:glutamate synthase (NADPH) small chain